MIFHIDVSVDKLLIILCRLAQDNDPIIITMLSSIKLIHLHHYYNQSLTQSSTQSFYTLFYNIFLCCGEILNVLALLWSFFSVSFIAAEEF